LIEAFPSVNYTYHSSNQSHINTGNNLAGYCSWGNDGGMGQYYAIDELSNGVRIITGI